MCGLHLVRQSVSKTSKSIHSTEFKQTKLAIQDKNVTYVKVENVEDIT